MNFSKKNHKLKRSSRNFVSGALNLTFPKTTFILLMISMLFSSCSGNDDSLGSEQEDFFLTAKIDGVDFMGENVFVNVFFDNDMSFYTISSIGDNSIGLTLEGPVSTGTFTIGDVNAAMSYQEIEPFMVWSANENAGNGTIIITENTDTYVKGTFTFTGFNTADNTNKVISDGNFKAQKLE